VNLWMASSRLCRVEGRVYLRLMGRKPLFYWKAKSCKSRLSLDVEVVNIVLEYAILWFTQNEPQYKVE